MTKKILLSIFLICIALTLYFKFISNTTINNIQEYPDKYINKKVKIIAIRQYYFGTTYGDLKGFGISDGAPFGGMFVSYIGDTPSVVIKDKWDRDKYVKVKVTGIVRHKIIKLGFKESGMFYIEGESWEYVD